MYDSIQDEKLKPGDFVVFDLEGGKQPQQGTGHISRIDPRGNVTVDSGSVIEAGLRITNIRKPTEIPKEKPTYVVKIGDRPYRLELYFGPDSDSQAANRLDRELYAQLKAEAQKVGLI